MHCLHVHRSQGLLWQSWMMFVLKAKVPVNIFTYVCPFCSCIRALTCLCVSDACSNTWELQELRVAGAAYWLDTRTRRVYQDMSGEGWPELVGIYDETSRTIREMQKSSAGMWLARLPRTAQHTGCCIYTGCCISCDACSRLVLHGVWPLEACLYTLNVVEGLPWCNWQMQP